MRILHCILSKEYAGSEAYCCQLASLQATHTSPAHVAVLAKGNGDASYLRRLKREAAPAALASLPPWWPSAGDAIAIRSALKALAPTIVHTHLGRAARRAGAAARWLGIPHVATLHLDWRSEYAGCDGVICIAHWQLASIPESYRGHVEVIWNWAPPGAPAAAAETSRPGAGITFLSVGRLVPHKGMDVLVRAFRRAFATSTQDVRLVVAGAGPGRGELERLAAGDRRISLLGYSEDVAPIYRGADVYVSAARYEPFGLTLLEAMCAGCRLVCTRTQGATEILRNRSGVLWAEVGDVADLSRTLSEAARGSGRTAWDLAAFDAAAARDKIEAFYRVVLAARR